jgi:hypothetical protein
MRTLYQAIGWSGLVLLVIVPILLLRWKYGAQWKWLGLGVASWMLGVLVKQVLAVSGEAVGQERLCPVSQATINGLISALTELGAAAWFLRRAQLRWADILAFGVAIGAFEVFVVLWLVWLEWLDGPPAGSLPPIFELDLLVQRSIAMMGHVASRVLVYVGLRMRWLLPALIAVTLFSLVDGVADYSLVARWDWSDPKVITGYYLFAGIVSAVEALAAWFFWSMMKRWRTRGSAS